jgi:CRISPR type III-A-associated protein Csm2
MNEKNQGFFQGKGGRDDRKQSHPPGDSRKSNPGPEKIVFRDEQKHLRRELLVDDAKKWANEQIAYQKVSYTQLRKFYSEALTLKSKVKEKGFKEMEALIGMMISKAHYAMIRDKNNQGLYHFINSCITSVHSEQDYNDFVLFFEAVLGFYPRKN